MSRRDAPRVLVLGRDDRAFLTVVRSLGRGGCRVHLAWCPPEALARQSRYVETVHDLPPYSPTNDAWKTAFLELCRAQRFSLVVPCNDITVMPLQRHRQELEPHVPLYLLPPQAYALAFDKARIYELAASLGINLPRQVRLTLPATPEEVLDQLPLPVVFKPRTSFAPGTVEQKRVVRKAFTRDELGATLHALRGQGETFVQEYFEGRGRGVEGLTLDGEVLHCMQHVRIHERRLGGADSYRKSVPLHPELHDAFVRMIRALGYTGVGMLEFRVDDATGRWVLLEMNARFWASLPLAVSAGADYPYWLYQMLVEGRRDFPAGYRTHVYCRNWSYDLVWLRENFQPGSRDRAPLGALLREIGPILRLREHNDTMVLDDPRPGLVDLLRLARRGQAKLGRMTRAALANVGPVRAVRRLRARRALRRAQTILFVCKGNLCRSPFAEAYARRRVGHDRRVLSAGYDPKQGRPCPKHALAAAREVGVDLTLHRSTVVSDDLVRRSSLIFVFDQENWETMTTRFPFARGKIHRLGNLTGNGRPDIQDPYGRDLDDFRATYQRIVATLDSALEG